MTQPDPTPSTPTWVRSQKLGNPEALLDLLDLMRQARDWLQIIDPIAQGMATVAEIEIRLIEIFQILSAPRALGLVLSELLMDFLKEYLTDGVYFIQHGNTRELFERTGTAQFIEGMESYVKKSDLEHLAAKTGEMSSFVQFGPEADSKEGAFQSFRRYPEIIQGQIDMRSREAVKTALDAFQDVEFNAFNDWLSPILAAFYDPGDPFKPVVFDQDKVGGFLFAIQSEDPIAGYEAFLTLKSVFFEVVNEALTFSDVWENLDEELGFDTIEKWSLTDSLQWNGVQSALRPHLVPRYSSSPDFERLSSADILPALGDLLLNMTNLAEFTGFPFPENFSMLAAAERLAQKVRKLLELFDRTTDMLTRIADVLDLADVWRLQLPPESGGIDALVERIKSAPRDDIVRITWGTIVTTVNDDGSPAYTEYSFSRITKLPTNTTGITEYNDEQVGDWMLEADIAALAAAFASANRTPFNYTTAKVIRAGETMRKSRAESLKKSMPNVAFGPPGNMMIYGLGVFYVDGALSRLFDSLFGPTTEDWDEYLCDGPPALADISAVCDVVTNVLPNAADGLMELSDTVGDSGVDRASDGSVPLSDTDAGVDTTVPPERLLRRLDRYGSGRSVEGTLRAIVSVPSARARRVSLAGGSYPLLGSASLALGDQGSTWISSATRMVATSNGGHVPHSATPASWSAAPYTLLPTEEYTLGTPISLTSPFPVQHSFSDISITDGGCSVLSPTLSAQLATYSFTTPAANEHWCLDLKLTFADSVSRYCRCFIEAHDDPANLIYVYPALPSAPIITSTTSLTGYFFVADEPSLWMDPAAPSPTSPAMINSAPGVSFDVAASWRKSADVASRSQVLGADNALTLQAVSGAHTVSVDSGGWGNYASITISNASYPMDLTVGGSTSLTGTVRDLTNQRSWPYGDLLGGTSTSFTPGQDFRNSPAEVVATWRTAADAQNTLTVQSMNDSATSLYSPPHALPEVGDLWRTLSVCAPRQVRIGVGIAATTPKRVYVQPSLWSHLLAVTGSTWTRIELSGLTAGQPDDVSDLLGDLSRKSWYVTLSAATAATYAGQSIVLVFESGPNTGLSAEGTYGRVRPHALFVPWVRHSATSGLNYEPGDQLMIGARPWGRAGVSGMYGTTFGGADPVDSGSIWYETLPKTGKISLRPEANLRAGGVALEVVTARSTWCYPIGTFEVLKGSGHRVLLAVGDVGLTWTLEERTVATAPVWFVRTSVTTGHFEAHVHLGIVIDALPSLSKMDLLISTFSGSTWTSQGISQVTVATSDPNPTVRTLEGLKEAGGTWRMGRPSWRGSIMDTGVRLPWETDDAGVLCGLPPCGFVQVLYKPLSVDVPEEMLDLYR